jgi:uncharacterized protein (TIGR03435 family)
MLNARSVPLPDAAFSLSAIMGLSVVDRTGISGVFDVHPEWTPNQAAASPQPPEEF